MPEIFMKGLGIFSLYRNALHKRPYLMQAFQAGILMGTGDIISQTIIEKKSYNDINFKRALQFSSIGFCIGGPALRMWYGFLNKYIGSTGKTVTFKKVFIDQVIFAPTFLVLILGAVGTMQGKSWNTVKSDVQANYMDVLKTNYIVWPWVQLINFYFTPLQYQVLVVQSVALFWNTYLSWKTNNKSINIGEKNDDDKSINRLK